MENKLQVANTILEQLGGNRFAMMTGAKNFAGGHDYLSFGIPSNNMARVSHVIVRYNEGQDLYEMKFMSIRGIKCKDVASFEGLFFDQLQSIFTQVTGLYTKL
jgi:hypothetical protein